MPEINSLRCCGQYNAPEETGEGSTNSSRKTHSHELVSRTVSRGKGSGTDSGGFGAIVEQIGGSLGCQPVNNASDCSGGPTVKVVKVRRMLSEVVKTKQIARCHLLLSSLKMKRRGESDSIMLKNGYF